MLAWRMGEPTAKRAIALRGVDASDTGIAIQKGRFNDRQDASVALPTVLVSRERPPGDQGHVLIHNFRISL